jgi:cytoskeletal protein CcmA (bactofilin family)
MPELDDDQFDNSAYRSQPASADQDAGAYSFGNYPAQSGQASQEPLDEDAPAIPEIPAADGLISVIASDASWKGEMSSENSIHVFGKVEGTLTAREDIWIAEGAEIDATVNASRIIVGGTLNGTVTATSRFEVLPTGHVSAEVTSSISVVHEGANINGNFRVGGSGGGEGRSSSSTVVQRRARSAS